MIKTIERFLEWGGIKREVGCLAISGVALLLSLFWKVRLPFEPAWIAIVFCGLPILLEAFVGLVTAFDIKADVLVSLALIASVLTGEYFAAGEVAFIMQLGALLEDLTVAKARAGIERLVQLTPQTARVVRQGKEKIIPAQEVKIGDLLRVNPGEMVPVDGVILSGQTSINQAVMTGEPLPVDKTAGDEVASGTVNQFGTFEMRATKVGDDSSIQRMIRLVQSADAGKAKIVGLADRWATWIVVIALLSAALTWAVTGLILRAVTILVVFCPCALVLATPTAIMAAIGNATKHGFLVREGDALERLASVTDVAFDKTGTLTYGTPEVVAVQSLDEKYTEQMLFRLTAAVEKHSEHPLGKAVVRCYQQQEQRPLPDTETFEMLPGRGVIAKVEGIVVMAGNAQLLTERGVDMQGGQAYGNTWQEQGGTIIYLAINNRLVGFLVLADTIRPQSSQMIREIQNMQIFPILLTGDHAQVAQFMAHQMGIQKIQADCLPEDKLTYIRKAQDNGQFVCMLGDGINDAPALKTAAVGVAMGGIGSDIAMDAADIVLVDDEIKELPHLLWLAKRMMVTIRCNLTLSMALNFIAIVLAMTGILNPVVGALVHNAGSVLVIVNSALLLTWRKRR